MGAIASNVGSFDWSAAAAWVGGVPPTEGDTCTIVNGSTITIDDAAPATITVGADSGTAAIRILSGGKLQYLSTATVDHTIVCKGDYYVDIGGTEEFGTVANPIPAARKLTIKLNYSASLSTEEYNYWGNGASTLQGAPKTVSTLLTANAAAAQAVLTVASTTGWAADDVLGIAPTSRTYTQYEEKIILTVDSPTQVTLTTNLSYAHAGVAPTQGHVVNLTRNILITSYNASYKARITPGTTGTLNWDYVEGKDLTTLQILTTSGSCNLAYCSMHNMTYNGFNPYGAAVNNFTLSNCVIYNGGLNGVLFSAVSSGTNWTIDSCVSIYSSQIGFSINDVGGTFTNNVASGAGAVGILLYEQYAVLGNFTGLIAYTNSTKGIQTQLIHGGTIGCVCWRNNDAGLHLYRSDSITVNGITAFGNNGYAIFLESCGETTLKTPVVNSDASYAQNYGLYYNNYGGHVNISDGSFGTTLVHANADFYIAAGQAVQIDMQRTTLATGVEIAKTNAMPCTRIYSEDHDGTTKYLYWWTQYGDIYTSTTYKYGASIRGYVFKPSSATYYEWLKFTIPVLSGQTPSITFYASSTTAVEGEGDFNGNATIEIDSNFGYGLTLAPTAINFGDWPNYTLNTLNPAGTANRNADVVVIVKVRGTAGRLLLGTKPKGTW